MCINHNGTTTIPSGCEFFGVPFSASDYTLVWQKYNDCPTIIDTHGATGNSSTTVKDSSSTVEITGIIAGRDSDAC